MEGRIIENSLESEYEPLSVEQLKLLKIGDIKVNYSCLYSNCGFMGICTIDEIDEHIKKYHHKCGLFYSKSARYFSKIEKIK